MLEIRTARLNDATAMMQVRREAVLSKALSHYQQPILDAWVAVTPDRVARFKQEIADPEFLVLVAEAGSAIIGFTKAILSKGEMRAIYVKPNSIGRVGHALLSQLEKHAFKTAEALDCVAALNAVQFYTAHGYIGQGPIDYVDSSGARFPCIEMKKLRPNPLS